MGALYLATTRREDGRFELHYWQGAQTRLLGTVDEQPFALAPRPEGLYVLLSTNQVIYVAPGAMPVPLGTVSGLGVDMMAIPGPEGRGTRLLVGNNTGLLEFRYPLGGER
jgi:hypothetical protein